MVQYYRGNHLKLIRGRGTGGALGASAPPPPPHTFLYLGKKCPFSGMKVPYFHEIEVPFLQNLSALFGQCPLTFGVLPRPLKLIEVSLDGRCHQWWWLDFISLKAIKTSLALTVWWVVAWTFKIESCLHVNRSRYDGQPAMHYVQNCFSS